MAKENNFKECESMDEKYLFQIRVTGVLLQNDKLLVVKQKLSNRMWSLPGGKLENGESIEECLRREMFEETGLHTQMEKMLYVCEKKNVSPPVIHITFLVTQVGGEITLPTNEFDENPIFDVKWVDISKLPDYGFSCKFVQIIENHFADAGKYMGDKSNIGL